MKAQLMLHSNSTLHRLFPVMWGTLSLLFQPSLLLAGDWPEIHGPHRNGHADREQLAANWDPGPIQQWSATVGAGYAGAAVVDGHVFVFHRTNQVDRLDCLAAKDGARLWSADWPASYRGGIDSDTGPRCVPLVRAGQIFLLSAAGEMHCLDLAGKKQWSRNLAKDFGAQDGYFGFGSTPLVIGDIVMVNIGGKKNAAVVALDVKTGKNRWRQFDDAGSYAAPIEWQYKNEPCAVFVTRLNLLGLRPDDGDVLFQMPFGARGPTVNAAAPLVIGPDRLFVTASYRIGAKALSVGADKKSPEVIWTSDESLSSQYPTPVFDEGFLYGVHGREDGPPAELRCVDAATGKVSWSKSNVGMAHLILADDKLLMLTVDGELVLLEKSPIAFRELGRLRVSDATTRALPALADGQLFVRSTDGKLSAWQLPAAK